MKSWNFWKVKIHQGIIITGKVLGTLFKLNFVNTLRMYSVVLSWGTSLYGQGDVQNVYGSSASHSYIVYGYKYNAVEVTTPCNDLSEVIVRRTRLQQTSEENGVQKYLPFWPLQSASFICIFCCQKVWQEGEK